MIEIEFNLGLAHRMGRKRQTLDIGESLSLSQLEAKLGLTADDVGILLINEAWAPLDSIIKDGDSVKIYPFMEGG
ncbi:MAG TPA: MoaD/ThiS family protein [Acidobacteriota bacterium]|nr:MoaD/ThiS family protein [Acidobacteriota bacterium]